MKKTILLLYSLFTISLTLDAQVFQWAKREGDQTGGNIICTDNAGNSYVYGRIFITTTVGGQSLNITNGEHFIAKYDNLGNALWVKQMNSMEASDLECNSTDLYISGRYGANASFGGAQIGSGSGWDGYVARISAGGNLTWVTTITNASTYESANSVAVDNSGNVYVAGTFSGASALIGSTTITGPGMESMLLLKLASDGSVIWSKTASANTGGSVSGNRVEIAPSGDLYVMSTADGDTAHYDSFNYFAGSYPAELLLHYNNTGAAMHMVEINHNAQDNVTSMTVDGSGNVYTLQTNYLTSFTLSKFNSMLANTWSITDGTGGHLSVRDVEVTQSGQVMVAGDVGEDATFGGTNVVYDYGGGNGFLAFYTNAGVYSSLKQIPGSVFMGSASIDASDNVYVTGSMSDSAAFDAINLTSSGVEAMFLARYGVSTGITSLDENSFSVYPNPCSGILTCNFKSADQTMIQLYNALGEKVFEKTVTSEQVQIDLSGYKKGIYLMNIGNEGSMSGKRIIVN
ncbi:MAG TPA: T9SS type A sorting domain-containing protein [Bacteroidia bacterium]|jgi:hypothetical protein